MKKIICLIAVILMFAGIGIAEEVVNPFDYVRPEVDIRITGDALGLAGGVSVGPFVNKLLYTDLKYVIMANDNKDNKLQLGLGLDALEAVNQVFKANFNNKNVSLRVGLATDILDDLKVKYFAGAFWRF